MPSIERPIVREHTPAPEREHTDHYSSLHTRLLLTGDALNPENTALTQVGTHSFVDRESRDYSMYTTASQEERKEFWKNQPEQGFAAQMQRWTTDTVEKFTNKKDFFTTTPEGQAWSQVFTRLGIDTQNVTAGTVTQLYDTYARGTKPEENIKKFVTDTIAKLDIQNGTIDQNTQDALVWLSKMFGRESSEMVRHLIIAEAKLAHPPSRTQLIGQSNKDNRINTINSDEKRVLEFVWGKGRKTTGEKIDKKREQPIFKPEPPKPTVDPENRWTLDQKTRFTDTADLTKMKDPLLLAQGLQQRFPDRYGRLGTAALAQQLQREQEDLDTLLKKLGFEPDQLEKKALAKIEEYEQFIQMKYGIQTPEIEKIHFFPISGKTTEYYLGDNNAYAFVTFGYPVIFLNMDVIARDARRRHYTQNGLNNITPENLSKLMEEMLDEINPHEFTHLAGDLKYWRLTKPRDPLDRDRVDLVEPHVSVPAKAGLMVIKPENNGASWRERGRGIMEAVTVELTEKWLESTERNTKVDAYAEERVVLDELKKVMAKDQRITEDDAFKKFAKAYFDPREFRHLVKELSAPTGKPGEYARPHYTSIIFGLMEYEEKYYRQYRVPLNYSLTLNYIRGNLSNAEKARIINATATMPVSDTVRKYLISQMLQKSPSSSESKGNSDQPVTPDREKAIPSAQEITADIARTNPELFKKRLIGNLGSLTVYGKNAWDKAQQLGLVSLDKIRLTNSSVSSSRGDTVTLGTQSWSPQARGQYLFEGDKFSYTQEMTHHVIHEVVHKLRREFDKNEKLLTLFSNLAGHRQENKEKSFSPHTQMKYYRENYDTNGLANEDYVELLTMYLLSPQYFKKYLVYLSDPQHQEHRSQQGLVTLSPEAAQNLYNLIDQGVKKELSIQPSLHPSS